MVDKRLLSGAFLSLLLSSTLLLTFCSTAPVHAAASWNVQTVDVNGYGGNGYCPVILDSGGTPHIAYTDAYVYYNEDAVNDYLTGSVMHARWNSSLGGFSTRKIARPGVVTDIALDAQDNPQILYRIGFQEFFQWNTESLKYASWTGSNWDIQTVNKNYTVYASLALDSSGNPNAAYSDSKSVKYASRNGSIWTIQAVDTGIEIPFHLDLAIDSNDIPSILYSLGDRVKLAVWANSGWNIQTVVSNVSGFGNLVLDSKGQPHFVYSVDHTTIIYARWNGISWTYRSVSNVKWLEQGSGFPFLALDSLDYPHISYLTAEAPGAAPELMYAAWTGTAWNIQTVAPGDGPPYLAVDSNRIPHISYYLGTGPPASIMYAIAAEPVPLYSPLPLQLVLTAVAIGAAVFVVYLWKKKT